MILFLGLIFLVNNSRCKLSIRLLFNLFNSIQKQANKILQIIHCPQWLSNMLINGIYQTLTWIIAVMLPPMAIFFPLFTILEDLGVSSKLHLIWMDFLKSML